jgi:hypothetical protein
MAVEPWVPFEISWVAEQCLERLGISGLNVPFSFLIGGIFSDLQKCRLHLPSSKV